MTVLLVIFSYIKKYWQYILIALLFLWGFFELQNSATAAQALKEAQARHDDELKAIRAAQAAEDAKRALIQKTLQDTLAKVETAYKDAQIKLDDTRRAEIEAIVKNNSDDPAELARLLQKTTGFRIE